MKVRDILTPLRRADLKRLCERRELPTSGTVPKLLERLARSYRGDSEAVMEDLRREDLVAVGVSLERQLDLPAGWRQLRVSEMRRAFTAAATGAAMPSEVGVSDEHFGLYSTNGAVANGGIRGLDLDRLRQDGKDAKQTTVISAYYSVDTLKRLLGDCRRSVRVILNGLGGRRLQAQVEELEGLQKALRAHSRKSEVRLDFADGVYHTKLYLFEKADQPVAWLGSANATAAGLSGHNEELLARLSPAPSVVLEFAERAWCRAFELEACRAPVCSLTAFYRTGMLYYKPYALMQKTFNPFRRLMARLPQAERDKITAFSSDFAEVEVGIGAFSIDRVLERDPQREIEGNVKGAQREDSNGERLHFRQYAVETCYGYWVSEKYVDEVDALLESASQSKSATLQRLREWLVRREEFIVEAYQTYLATARETMDSRGVAWRKHGDPQLFADTEPVRKQIRSLVDKLSDEKRFKRYCQAYVSSEVPELWQDSTALEAFESSFFEWLAACSSGRRRPKAAVAILDAIGAYDEEAEAIRAKLAKQLADPEWYKSSFKKLEW